ARSAAITSGTLIVDHAGPLVQSPKTTGRAPPTGITAIPARPSMPAFQSWKSAASVPGTVTSMGAPVAVGAVVVVAGNTAASASTSLSRSIVHPVTSAITSTLPPSAATTRPNRSAAISSSQPARPGPGDRVG